MEPQRPETAFESRHPVGGLCRPDRRACADQPEHQPGDSRAGDGRRPQAVSQPRRWFRTCADAADRDSVVCSLHVPFRPFPELLAIVCGAGFPGTWIRRRVGGRSCPSGGIDPRGTSRQSTWHYAGRMGCRMGNGDDAICHLLYLPSSGNGMARVIPVRHRAGCSRLLRSTLCGRAAGVPGIKETARGERRPAILLRNLQAAHQNPQPSRSAFKETSNTPGIGGPPAIRS